jgi:hypothetical protein
VYLRVGGGGLEVRGVVGGGGGGVWLDRDKGFPLWSVLYSARPPGSLFTILLL